MATSKTSDAPTIPGESWIIDTPGIKGFGLLDIEKEEVGHYFREIFQISRDCRYSNCVHTGEPGCAVYQAVVNGDIALSRYESYLSILEDTNEGKYR
jgi:ribosome biogenesis GTPase